MSGAKIDLGGAPGDGIKLVNAPAAGLVYAIPARRQGRRCSLSQGKDSFSCQADCGQRKRYKDRSKNVHCLPRQQHDVYGGRIENHNGNRDDCALP